MEPLYSAPPEKLLGTALQGKPAQAKDDETLEAVPALDADLIRVLAERPSKDDSDASRLRSIVAQVLARNT